MAKNATCDYSVLLKEHQNKWIALSSDTTRVVAVADSAQEAIAKAKESNENNPVLTKTSEGSGALIL